MLTLPNNCTSFHLKNKCAIFFTKCDVLSQGMCNGDPFDDLKMQNRTIITHIEEIEAFIRSWEIEKSVDVMIRRPVRNCTEDNCTYCMELLNRKVFIPCHKKVSTKKEALSSLN